MVVSFFWYIIKYVVIYYAVKFATFNFIRLSVVDRFDVDDCYIILLYSSDHFRMEFLDSPSDMFHSFCSHSTTLLPSLIQKIHKMLTDGHFVCFEYFGALLTEIEKHAYSSKELRRFHAAYALMILSRTSCTILIHSHSYRYRLIFHWKCYEVNRLFEKGFSELLRG